MLVPRERLAEVEELATAAAAGFTPGDPLEPGTRLGPLVSANQRERVRGFIAKGEAEGAKLLTGGAEPPEGLDRGYFVRPTVFSEVTPEMTIAREEIFGPVLAMLDVDDFDHALAVANETSYGLAAGIWTRDIKKAHRAARALQAGTVWINAYNLYDAASPYGGDKASGFGRESGLAGLDTYLQTKSVWVDLS
jgi:acyl-CoA reductase-like NAD-dependent aldehyde dehydrogenase